jgi:hypothetical protein
MKIETQVVAKTNNEEKIKLSKKDLNLVVRTSGFGAVISLPKSKDGFGFDVLSFLRDEELFININEGKNREGLVTVVCDVDGKPLRPFWIKGGKNQRGVDEGIDARFSLYRPACVVTVSKRGQLGIYRIYLEEFSSYVEVKDLEIYSGLLKWTKGKFFLDKRISEELPYLNCFKEAIKVAIKKANSSNGGPSYFLEKPPDIIFHEEQSESMVLSKKEKTTVFLAGIALSRGHL